MWSIEQQSGQMPKSGAVYRLNHSLSQEAVKDCVKRFRDVHYYDDLSAVGLLFVESRHHHP